VDTRKCAKFTRKAIEHFAAKKVKHVKEIRVVIFDGSKVNPFQEEILTKSSPPPISSSREAGWIMFVLECLFKHGDL